MKKLILAALVLTACEKKDTPPADTAAAAITPTAPSMASMFAGTWEGRSRRVATDSGTPWTQVLTVGADGNLTGTLRFKAGTEDIPIRVTEVTHSSMKTEFGPYTSLSMNARGTATTDGTLMGDSLVGTFVFTPEGGGAPVNGLFVAKRAATP